MLAIAMIVAPATAAELTGTLQKIKETNRIILGIQEASVPFSYLDGDQKVIGYAVDICMKIVDADHAARDDAPFKAVADRATANLYRGPEIEVIYKKWFESPVPPSGLNFRAPMAAVVRNAFANPSDSPDPASYER
jgi:ABC-type amino acid transport substrate-binding protein